MKPAGGMRRERPEEIRHNMTPYVGGEAARATFPTFLMQRPRAVRSHIVAGILAAVMMLGPLAMAAFAVH
jgi:hypothetical protein